MNNEREQWAMAGLMAVGFIITGLNEDGVIAGVAIILLAALRLGFLLKS